MSKPDVRGLLPPELSELVVGLGAEPFRGRQLWHWVQQKGVGSWAEMSDVPRALRQRLAQVASLTTLEAVHRQESEDGRTWKYLLRLPDGELVEAVALLYRRPTGRERRTACVSSQVGCPLHCAFCATGGSGFRRNLTAGEILAQIHFINHDLRQRSGQGLTNLVFMGMGEPLLNYAAVVRAVRLVSAPGGLTISPRRITVSTCGVAPAIVRLSREGLPLVLAVSLHATRDSLRDRLVPINRRYPLRTLLAACREYAGRTGRRVSFAYVLLAGVNDTPAQARELAGLLRGLPCHLNLIPYNPVEPDRYHRPSPRAIRAFNQELARLGLEVSVREERGVSLEAACGQLRRREVSDGGLA